MPRERRALFVAGILLFFGTTAVWLTWPLGARLSTALSDSPDSLLNAWALGWSFHILPRDPFSLFNANIFAPRPDTLAYSEHLFGITVLIWPVYLLSHNLVLAYNVAFLSSFVLSGIGMYLLARELTGNDWAALAAGTIFMAVPYRFLHVLHLQLLTYQWFPFVFWFLLRFLREGTNKQLAGTVVFSLLQILSCNYYAVYLTLALLWFGVLWIGGALISPSEKVIRSKIWKLAFGAVGVTLLTVPFILPYQRNRDRGFYRRYEDTVHFSASSSDYLRPSAFNDAPYVGLLPAARSEKSLFPGFAALVLAGVGIATGRRRDPLFWTFAVSLTLGAALMSLGPETALAGGLKLPYRLFQVYFPGFNGMRVPARFATLVVFGVSILVAWGLATIFERVTTRSWKAAVGVATLAVLLFEYQTSSLERAVPEAPAIPAAHRWLAEAPSPGAVLVLPIHEGEDIVRESAYVYYSTSHFRPLVNGYSGWWPNDYWELVGRLRHFPTSRSLRFLLERAPVRYVVIHYGRIPQPRRRQLEAAMLRYRERMPERFRDGTDVVYEIIS